MLKKSKAVKCNKTECKLEKEGVMVWLKKGFVSNNKSWIDCWREMPKKYVEHRLSCKASLNKIEPEYKELFLKTFGPKYNCKLGKILYKT